MSKGHSILLNNTFQTYKLCLNIREIYSFLFISIFLYINSKLNQIADFYSKTQNNVYITKGRVTWHMYEFCNFIWIYSRFFFLLIILKDYWHQILQPSLRVLHSESKRENVADCFRLFGCFCQFAHVSSALFHTFAVIQLSFFLFYFILYYFCFTLI
jgi:hypothetical protein